MDDSLSDPVTTTFICEHCFVYMCLDFLGTQQLNAMAAHPADHYKDGHKLFQFDGWLYVFLLFFFKLEYTDKTLNLMEDETQRMEAGAVPVVTALLL